MILSPTFTVVTLSVQLLIQFFINLSDSLQASSSWSVVVHLTLGLTELQIRGGIEDNSKIIFLVSQRKHIL